MSFLAPLFLAGAIAAAIPVVLHLLRREPEARVKFAAVRMLEHAPVEHADRRRLRQLLLLALRVAALLLLAFAFARPYVASGASGAAARVTVVALDTSFSLDAPGRFARAQALARTALDRAPEGQLVAVVTFADAARVAAAPTGDRRVARAAIDAAAAGAGGTRYRAALAAAADVADGRPGTVVVVTDLQADGWDAGESVSLPGNLQVETSDVGAMPPDLAVVAAFHADGRLVATVRNTGPEARDARLSATVDGRPAGDATGTVAAGQTADVTLPAVTGATAAIAVADPDGLQADNVRYLVLAASARPPVLVVTNAGDLGRDAFYLQQAVTAGGPEGAAFEATAASGVQVSGWDAATIGRHAAVIVTSTRGLDQRGRDLLAEYVRRGGGLLLASGPDVDPDLAAGALGGAVTVTALPPVALPAGAPRTLAPTDVRHPVFRAFAADAATLGLVTFQRIASVRGSDCRPLARFSTGETALLDCSRDAGRTLVFASDLDDQWNDFPLHATFVPFLHEALGYLAGARGRTGGMTVGSTPAGVPPVPGFVDTPAGRAAVNIDPREADSTRLTPDEFQAPIATAPQPAAPSAPLEARQQEERQNLWKYAILFVIAALVAESLIAARTV